MMFTIGFDIYGTLVNTDGVIQLLQSMVGDKASAFSKTWREKQLEYTFRRSAMNCYVRFPIVTAESLAYCDRIFNSALSSEQKEALMLCYAKLPAYQEVRESLALLKGKAKMYAFSNGTRSAIDLLLQQANISIFFDGIVSVDDVCVFKPHPATYAHFLDTTKTKNHAAVLISSNPFDIIGAKSYGMHAIWLQRDGNNHFDPWGEQNFLPDQTISTLHDLPKALQKIAF